MSKHKISDELMAKALPVKLDKDELESAEKVTTKMVKETTPVLDPESKKWAAKYKQPEKAIKSTKVGMSAKEAASKVGSTKGRKMWNA